MRGSSENAEAIDSESTVRGHRSVTPRRLGDGNNLDPMVPTFIPSGVPTFPGIQEGTPPWRLIWGKIVLDAKITAAE